MIYHFLDILLEAKLKARKLLLKQRILLIKSFDPDLNLHHTEDIIMNHLNVGRESIQTKLKEINLGEITNYVHQVLFKKQVQLEPVFSLKLIFKIIFNKWF